MVKQKGLNVLSLFDGMSCGQIALQRVGIEIANYYASEIDKHAIKVTQSNYPDTAQLGSVTNIDPSKLPKIDLLIGGSPCTDISFAGKKIGIGVDNLEDYLKLKSQGYEFQGQSYLFWEYVRILKEIKPKYFLLENVRMKKETQEIFESILGVKAIAIDSKLVSAQNRYRLYFTNIPNIEQPKDKGLLLKDILEDEVDGSFYLPKEKSDYILSLASMKNKDRKDVIKNKTLHYGIPRGFNQTGVSFIDKSPTLTINSWQHNHFFGKFIYTNHLGQNGSLIKNKSATLVCASNGATVTKEGIRKLTPVEAERLQTVPDNYTSCVSNSQRYKMLGNGWTVDVIAHIFRNLKNE